MFKRLFTFGLILCCPLAYGMNKKKLSGNQKVENKQKEEQHDERNKKITDLMSIFKLISESIKPEELLLDSRMEKIVIKLIDMEAWSNLREVIKKASGITYSIVNKVGKLNVIKESGKIIYQILLLEHMDDKELLKYITTTPDFYQKSMPQFINVGGWGAINKLIQVFPEIDEKFITEVISLNIHSEKNKVNYLRLLLKKGESLKFSREFFQRDEGKQLTHWLVKYDSFDQLECLFKQGFILYEEDMFLPLLWDDITTIQRGRWLELVGTHADNSGGYEKSDKNFIYKPSGMKLVKQFMLEKQFDMLKSVFQLSLMPIDDELWEQYCFFVRSLIKINTNVKGVDLYSQDELDVVISKLISKGYVSLVALAYYHLNINITREMFLKIVEVDDRSHDEKTRWLSSIFAIQNELVKQGFCQPTDVKDYHDALIHAILNSLELETKVIIEQIALLKHGYHEGIKSLQERIDLLESESEKERKILLEKMAHLHQLSGGALFLLLDTIISLKPRVKNKIIEIYSEEEKLSLINKTIELFDKYQLGGVESINNACKLRLLAIASLHGCQNIFDDLVKNKKIDPFEVDEDGETIVTVLITENDQKTAIKAITNLIKILKEDNLKVISPSAGKKNPLCLAAGLGKWEIVDFLLKNNANPCTINEKRVNLLYHIVSDSSCGLDGSDRSSIMLTENKKIVWIEKLVNHVDKKELSNLFEPDGGVAALLSAVSQKSKKIFKKMKVFGASLHKLAGEENIFITILCGENCPRDRRIELMEFILDNCTTEEKKSLLAPMNGKSPIILAMRNGDREELIWLFQQGLKKGMEEVEVTIRSIPFMMINHLEINQELLLKMMNLLIEVSKETGIFDKMFNGQKDEHNLIFLAYLKKSYTVARLFLKSGVNPRLLGDEEYFKFIATAWREQYEQSKMKMSSLSDEKMWLLISLVLKNEEYAKIILNMLESGIEVPTTDSKVLEEMFQKWSNELCNVESISSELMLNNFLISHHITIPQDARVCIVAVFDEWLKNNKTKVLLNNQNELSDDIDVINDSCGIDEKKELEAKCENTDVQVGIDSIENQPILPDIKDKNLEEKENIHLINNMNDNSIQAINIINGIVSDIKDDTKTTKNLSNDHVREISGGSGPSSLINHEVITIEPVITINQNDSLPELEPKRIEANSSRNSVTQLQGMKNKNTKNRESLLIDSPEFNKTEFERIYDLIKNTSESRIMSRSLHKQLLESVDKDLGKQLLALIDNCSQIIGALSKKIGVIKDHQDELEYQIKLKQHEIEGLTFVAGHMDYSEKLGHEVTDNMQQRLVIIAAYSELFKITDNKKDIAEKDLLELIKQQKDVFVWLNDLKKQKRVLLKEKKQLQKKYDAQEISEGRWSREARDPRELSNNYLPQDLILRGLDLA